MRILLIYPPITARKKYMASPGISPPLGLAYLAAYLREYGRHEVCILDCLAEGINCLEETHDTIRYGLSSLQILKVLENFQPEVVGVSVMFTALALDAHAVARLVKTWNPQVKIVFGGAHASAVPDWVLRDKNVDVVVIGEGEETFLELIDCFEKQLNIERVLGIAYRSKNECISLTDARPYIQNLDSLPFPARDLLPMDVYFTMDAKVKDSYVMRTPVTCMVTSRGCPGRCIFCSIHSIWGHKWRPRSAKNVVDEVEFLVREYGIREIHFNDDNISASKGRMHELCNELIKRKLDIKWTTPNGIAVWTLDRPLLEKMKQSGCYRLTYGIESGCPETLRFIRKKLDLVKASEVLKICSDIGIWTFATYIIGFPYERPEDIKESIEYAIASECDLNGFIILMPFPGTEIYKILEAEGMLKQSDFEGETVDALLTGIRGVDTKYVTIQELKEFQSRAYRRQLVNRFGRALVNPSRIFKKVNSLEELFYAAKIAANYFHLLGHAFLSRSFKCIRPSRARSLQKSCK